MTVAAGRVAVLPTRVVTMTQSSTRFSTYHGDMVGIVAMTLRFGNRLSQKPTEEIGRAHV